MYKPEEILNPQNVVGWWPLVRRNTGLVRLTDYDLTTLGVSVFSLMFQPPRIDRRFGVTYIVPFDTLRALFGESE